MGNKRLVHLKTLQVKALAGDKVAQKALEAELYVPHHRRAANKGIPAGVKTKQGLAITAKTYQARKTRDTVTIGADYGLERLQMLKDRRDRRAAA